MAQPEQPAPRLDKRGWPVLLGSYVRVERARSFRGDVIQLGPDDLVRLRDSQARVREARLGECVVVRPTKRSRAQLEQRDEITRAASARLRRRRVASVRASG